MSIAFLNEFDKNYPMSINDGWGGACYISSDTLENEKKWNDFINELNKVRNKYLNQVKKEIEK